MSGEADVPDRAERYGRLGRLLLCAALLLGLALRLHGISFGLPAINDSDELMFQMGAVRLLSGPTLNPGWFGHPATTTIYVLALINLSVFLFGWSAGWFNNPHDFATAIYADPTWVMLPGRLAMVGFGVACIALIYRLTLALFGKRAAIFAAFLMALNPLYVTYSQVIRSDVMATAFMLMALLAMLKAGREGGARPIIKAGFLLALAIVTKWPFALAGLAMAGLLVKRVRSGEETAASAMRRVLLFGALTLVFCVVISPYIVLDYPVLLANLQGEAQVHHLGATGGSPLHNLWWYARGPFLDNFGLLGIGLIAIGAGLAVRRYKDAAFVIFPVIAGFLLIISSQSLIWERWLLPIVTLAIPLAGAGLAWAYDRMMTWNPRVRLAGSAAGLLALFMPMTVQAFDRSEERMHDTRQRASAWSKQHLPENSTVLLEHFAFDLLPMPWTFLFPMGDAGCVDAKAMLTGKISYSVIQSSRGQRSNVDYGTMNPRVRSTCQSDFAILTQYDRYAAERSRFPAEYKAYEDLLSGGKIVATFRPDAGSIGGPVVRIIQFNPAKPADTCKGVACKD